MPRRLSQTTSSSTVPSSPTEPPTLIAIVLPTYSQMYGSASSSAVVVWSSVGRASGRVSTVFHDVRLGQITAPGARRSATQTQVHAHTDFVAVHLGAGFRLLKAGRE